MGGCGGASWRNECAFHNGIEAFLGDSEDLVRNVRGVAPVVDLDGDEVGHLVAK